MLATCVLLCYKVTIINESESQLIKNHHIMKTHHWFTGIMLVWLSVLGGSLAAQTVPTAFVKGLELINSNAAEAKTQLLIAQHEDPACQQVLALVAQHGCMPCEVEGWPTLRLAASERS